MKNSITHFEIYGPNPGNLADFYQAVFGWRVERVEGVDYWRINTGSNESLELAGGLTYRAIPGLNGWLLYVSVASADGTIALIEQHDGKVVRPKTAVPRAGWVTIASDPQGNIFGVWQTDPSAFPLPEPD